MAYRPFNWVSNNASWGRTLHTKKGVLKRGYAEDFGGCGTLKPPPDAAGGPNDAFVLFWNGTSWKWGKLTYTKANAPDACTATNVGGEPTYTEGPDGILGTYDDEQTWVGGTWQYTSSNLIQSFAPLNNGGACDPTPNFTYYGVYDAECDDGETG